MGYSLSRMADHRARDAERQTPAVEPLAPGEDPLAALDPETRELVTSLEPAVDPDMEDGTTLGDRVGGALAGAGFGAFFGAVLVNWTARRHRFSGAPAMDVGMTVMAAAAGATIGGIAGWAKGRNPVGRDPGAHAQQVVGSTVGIPQAATHPAFAGVNQPTVVDPVAGVLAASSRAGWQPSASGHDGW